MSTKVPVNTIAQVVLREGFNKGKFNPDMMLNLLEPTMFMLMALAEKAGIEPVVDSDEDDLESEEASELANKSKAFIKEGGRFEDARVKNIQPMSVGKDISDRLEKLDSAKVRASLLQRPEPKDRTSLLEK